MTWLWVVVQFGDREPRRARRYTKETLENKAFVILALSFVVYVLAVSYHETAPLPGFAPDDARTTTSRNYF